MFEKNIRLSVLTMDRVVFEGDVVSIVAPGSMGSFGVLAGHTQLVSSLQSGTIKLRYQDNREEIITIGGGFLEVNKEGEVVILTDNAEKNMTLK